MSIETFYQIYDILQTITDDASYEQCRHIDQQLNKLGYTAEYGLDAGITDIHELDDLHNNDI